MTVTAILTRTHCALSFQSIGGRENGSIPINEKSRPVGRLWFALQLATRWVPFAQRPTPAPNNKGQEHAGQNNNQDVGVRFHR